MQSAARDAGLSPSCVHVLAYLDDVVVVAPPELAALMLPMAQRTLGELDLELQPAKTQVWSARSECPAGLGDQWRADGLTLVGVPLGQPFPEGGPQQKTTSGAWTSAPGATQRNDARR